ncbi:anhydro-N-acetylmuramic acid kinase [Legionella geestiana]|uniref:Anhydro-N-acetylmuramic acid kinase n=1 Tax=Legionella geestiana TaxID=45065 RepID=A0A0W0TPL0_9GAMM|nr:anhydro-N-acetylmuramic acid kinase [Legionella geestiana]KTC97466.1 anhydro-N-acetylmuramic acid kinase [Legionella geestiana]QBS13327.1 anhydro-N-acetylmuramic acid kinase [Legionella geestiana]STX54143.1 anhydro-N-acetylmuramic acid kinase [Legionella geestiana]
MSIYLGLLSGTSMDGIDAALVDFPSHTLIHAQTLPYEPLLREEIATLCEGALTTPKAMATLNTRIGRAFGEAAREVLRAASIKPRDVIAIGSHGQTVFHDAHADIPVTVQLGCAHTIAEMTGIAVVSDFRTRDLVVGGQGAPLAPVYHAELFGRFGERLAIVNIGGIANVSFVESGKAACGFDTGPGNCLMDAWCARTHGQAFDRDGRFAAEGRVIPSLLDTLLSDPWFDRPIPRSIDKGYFSLERMLAYAKPDWLDADVQATLLAFTATTIAHAITARETGLERVLVCGGGAHNRALLKALSLAMEPLPVESTVAVSVNPDFVEAMLFAWLAHCAATDTPLYLKPITGSSRPVVLGARFPAGQIND